MANVRARIRLGDDEVREFLANAKTVIVGTNNHDGYPHLVPMWYSMLDGLVHMHTYKTSQKILNVERDPRGSILVEDGTEYDKLRGVFIRGRFEVRDDQELCYRIALASAKKYQGLDEEQAGAALRYYVRKRVALIFHPGKVSSWDHGKMAAASPA
ncbi:MAG TPA: pyridoxamine 5'-phosphate oxidase family protein [Candidatus Binatia bacterium]|jgi:nitroimidazol reductase NimA-like FMN-containing flavoprotein (pyridoxamine 5'-phosphate oxidase superfamily)